MLDVAALVLLIGAVAVPLRLLLGRLVRRTAVTWTLAVLAAFVVAGVATYRVSRSVRFQLFGHMVTPTVTRERVVALTFDDGPTSLTPQILAALRAHDVKATFFLTGSEIELRPEDARMIVAAGHEIGNHSWSHERMVFKGESWIQREIERTDALIRRSGHRGPILFRSPYGKRFVSLPWYLARHERLNVFWDLAPDGAPSVTQDELVRTVVTRAQPGSIVLLHVMYPSRESSRRALPGIIEGLRARGFRFVTVSELLALRSAQRHGGPAMPNRRDPLRSPR